MLPGMVFSMGLGMALSITVLGALREILGQGTILKAIENFIWPRRKIPYITYLSR